MGASFRRSFFIAVALIPLLLAAFPVRSAFSDDDPSAPSSAARLKFIQQVLRDIEVESTLEEKKDARELKFQMTPLLRYNDVERRIADSMIFRLGIGGRPVAIVTAELYNGSDRRYLLNHEFVAIDNPRIKLRRDVFRWQPPAEEALKFQPLDADSPPGDNPRARLARLKEFAAKFSIIEEWAGQQTKLRLLPTPIDRYVPVDKPNADAAVFAFVTGVNPEALLFLETDGSKWSFACAQLAAAALQAKWNDRVVWEVPIARFHEHPTAGYTSIHRNAFVPLELESKDDEERKKDAEGKK